MSTPNPVVPDPVEVAARAKVIADENTAKKAAAEKAALEAQAAKDALAKAEADAKAKADAEAKAAAEALAMQQQKEASVMPLLLKRVQDMEAALASLGAHSLVGGFESAEQHFLTWFENVKHRLVAPK